MLFDLLSWWYLKGWAKAWREIPILLNKVQLAFTLPILLSTLFSPWKRIISSGGRSIDEKFRAFVDNLVSRAVGFFVRLFVLLTALFLLLVTAIFSLAIAIAWPAVPFAIVFFIYKGIAG